MIEAFVEGVEIGARAIGAVVTFAGIGIFVVSLGVFMGWFCGRLFPEEGETEISREQGTGNREQE